MAARQPLSAPREPGGLGADGEAFVGMRPQPHAVVREAPPLQRGAVALPQLQFRPLGSGLGGDAKPVFGHPEHALRDGGQVEALIEVPDALLAGVYHEGGGDVDARAVSRNVHAVKPRLVQGIERLEKDDVLLRGLGGQGGPRPAQSERADEKSRRQTRAPPDAPIHFRSPSRSEWEAGSALPPDSIRFPKCFHGGRARVNAGGYPPLVRLGRSGGRPSSLPAPPHRPRAMAAMPAAVTHTPRTSRGRTRVTSRSMSAVKITEKMGMEAMIGPTTLTSALMTARL